MGEITVRTPPDPQGGAKNQTKNVLKYSWVLVADATLCLFLAICRHGTELYKLTEL